MTDYRDYKLNKKEKLMLLLVVAALCLLVGELFYGESMMVVLAPLGYVALEGPWRKILGEKRRIALRDQFRDVLYSFSASFATGRHIGEAMKEAEPYVAEIHGEDSYMAKELRHMIIMLESAGTGDLELWKDFGDRSGLEDVRDFSSVFRACRDTGGDLVGAASRAAKIISEKITLEGEIKGMSAQREFEGRIIGVMPAVMIAFLRMTSTGYMDVMYKTTWGRILMTGALSAMGLAIYLTEKITRIRV